MGWAHGKMTGKKGTALARGGPAAVVDLELGDVTLQAVDAGLGLRGAALEVVQRLLHLLKVLLCLAHIEASRPVTLFCMSRVARDVNDSEAFVKTVLAFRAMRAMMLSVVGPLMCSMAVVFCRKWPTSSSTSACKT